MMGKGLEGFQNGQLRWGKGDSITGHTLGCRDDGNHNAGRCLKIQREKFQHIVQKGEFDQITYSNLKKVFTSVQSFIRESSLFGSMNANGTYPYPLAYRNSIAPTLPIYFRIYATFAIIDCILVTYVVVFV